MVRLIKIQYLLPDDYDRLAILTSIPQSINESGIADELLTDYAECCREIEAKLNAVVQRDRSNPFTAVINDSHKRRLMYLFDIHSGILNDLLDDDIGKAGAAEVLKIAYDKAFKTIPNRRRVTYTVAIKSFLDFLQTTEATDLIGSVKMSDKVNGLSIAQDEYIRAVAEQVQSDKDERTASAGTARVEMYDLYEALEHHLFYMEYRGHPQYEELTEKLNNRIGKILAASQNSREQSIEEEIPENMEQSLDDLY